MWELDYEESWAPKNRCFWTLVLEETLENPLDCKEIQPVHPKGNQSWIFIGRTDAEAETPIFWPPDVKNQLTEKTLMPGKIEGGRRRGRWGWDGWMALPMQWTWFWVGFGGLVMDREAWRAAVHGVAKSWTWLSEWTELYIASLLAPPIFFHILSFLYISLLEMPLGIAGSHKGTRLTIQET